MFNQMFIMSYATYSVQSHCIIVSNASIRFIRHFASYNIKYKSSFWKDCNLGSCHRAMTVHKILYLPATIFLYSLFIQYRSEILDQTLEKLQSIINLINCHLPFPLALPLRFPPFKFPLLLPFLSPALELPFSLPFSSPSTRLPLKLPLKVPLLEFPFLLPMSLPLFLERKYRCF